MKAFWDWLVHAIDRSLSVYIIGAIVAIVVFGSWTFYRAFIQKNPNQTIQHADVVDSRSFHQTFGCMRIEAIKPK